MNEEDLLFRTKDKMANMRSCLILKIKIKVESHKKPHSNTAEKTAIVTCFGLPQSYTKDRAILLDRGKVRMKSQLLQLHHLVSGLL